MRSLLAGLLLLCAAPAAALTFVEAVRNGEGGVDGLDGAVALALPPGEAHLYVAARDDDAVVAFARDPGTGRLTFLSVAGDGVAGVDGLAGASAIASSPDGLNVYVAGGGEAAVAVFARDPATGMLAFVEAEHNGIAGVGGLAGASGVAVSPDGAHVYEAGSADGAVAVFAREATGGTLTFEGAVQDGVGGVDGIGGASALVLSPDGLHLYVASRGPDDAVAVFSRDALNGALTPVEAERDGVNGVDGLGGARAVATGPDGAQVYVGGALDDAVAVFVRDPTSGALTFSEVQRDGVAAVNGLGGSAGVAVSPDGTQLWATGHDEDAIAVFARAPGGALTFLEDQRNAAPDVDGVSGPTGLAASADAAFLYVAGTNGDAVAVFSTATTTTTSMAPTTTTTTLPPCPPVPRSGCRSAGPSSLVVAQRGRGPALRWRWNGPSLGTLEFGDPRRTTDYTLCVYDARSLDGALFGALGPAGGRCDGRSCWRPLRNAGYRYRDPDRTPGGIARIALQAARGRTRIAAVAHGQRLRTLLLPLAPPVIVQLVAADVACWEATYAAPAVNGPRRFRSGSTP